MKEVPLQIAIDGPVAAGKGDIAERLAKHLGAVYLYTGAMYRSLALACIRKSIPFSNVPQIVELLKHTTIELIPASLGSTRSYNVLLNGEDVTDRIMEPDAAMGASDVGVNKTIREEMVRRQQQMAEDSSVVMEGRDIGLRVLPRAQLKIYLTASLEERAKRRHEQFIKKGITRSFEEVLEDTKKRDEQDMNRGVDPLQKLPDAWELDTTQMTQAQVIDVIIAELKKRKLYE